MAAARPSRGAVRLEDGQDGGGPQHRVVAGKHASNCETFAHRESPHQSEARAKIARLTGKEHVILRALGEGLANADITRQLHLSEATVKTHVSRVLHKLELSNRVQTAILAHRAGPVAEKVMVLDRACWIDLGRMTLTVWSIRICPR